MPVEVRFDTGPEFIARAVAEWYGFHDTHSTLIDSRSPWQNAWIESFNGRPSPIVLAWGGIRQHLAPKRNQHHPTLPSLIELSGTLISSRAPWMATAQPKSELTSSPTVSQAEPRRSTRRHSQRR